MIAVDTNLLVRYLAHDDPAQTPIVSALFHGAAERGEQIYVSTVVLAEVVWVLTSVLRVAKQDLAAVLECLLAAAEERGGSVPLVLEHREAVRRALTDYTSGRADFADYLIGRLSEAAGATITYTFDRTAAAAPTFKRLQRR